MENKRRRLGHLIYAPINTLASSDDYDGLVFIEKDKRAASQTRAAALMYILRHGMNLCTHVRENKIYVLHEKDNMDTVFEVDIR